VARNLKERLMTTSCSRREALLKAAIFAGAATLAVTTGAEAKVAQKAAGYQDTPQDGKQCSGCAHFTAPGSCNIVDGTISPTGWCKLYSAKM
jgi:hypothetical protein